ncbi:hypothetical protein AB0C86_33220 [Streptomyces lavendulae]|uniref:hypothetical protein n=1 Tax=Streptomyces lavendulae TaxID=1914 RepID=UPI0033F0811D
MRTGFIAVSRKDGKREEEIRALSGHAADSPVFWGYIQKTGAWTDAGSEGIGL